MAAVAATPWIVGRAIRSRLRKSRTVLAALPVDPEHAVAIRVVRHRPAVRLQMRARRPHVRLGRLLREEPRRQQPRRRVVHVRDQRARRRRRGLQPRRRRVRTRSRRRSRFTRRGSAAATPSAECARRRSSAAICTRRSWQFLALPTDRMRLLRGRTAAQRHRQGAEVPAEAGLRLCWFYCASNRSRFITFVQAATKSSTNLLVPSSAA